MKPPQKRSEGKISPPFARKASPIINGQNLCDQYFQQGVSVHQQGALDLALAHYENALKANPRHADALHFRGLISFQMGKPEEAIVYIKESLKIRPDYFEALGNLGLISSHCNQHLVSLESYDKALQLKPHHGPSHYGRSLSLNALGQLQESLLACEMALELRYESPEVLIFCSHLCERLGDLIRALELLEHVIKSAPKNPDAYNNLGNILRALGRNHEALEAYNKAIDIKPGNKRMLLNKAAILESLDHDLEALEIYSSFADGESDWIDALSRRANLLFRIGRYEESASIYLKAIQHDPDNPVAHNNYGNVLKELKQYDAALAFYCKALSIDSEMVEALNNRGNIHQEMKRYELAAEDYKKALRLRSNYLDAMNNLGNAYRGGRDYEGALNCYRSVLSIEPRYAEALYNQAYTLFEMQRYKDSMTMVLEALDVRPDYTDALNLKGHLHFRQKEYKEALEAYDHLVNLDADYEEAQGMRLHTAMHLCQWENLDRYLAGIYEAFDAGALPSGPFQLLATYTPLIRLKQFAERYSETHIRKIQALPGRPWDERNTIAKPDGLPLKIRVAYFSCDYYRHATSYLMAEMLEKHDRSKFEIVGYCYAKSPDDDMRQRIINAFDEFNDVSALSDEAIAQHARKNRIDIAIDLKGHTQGSRLGIFAYRAAPIQMHYLGYPGTLGGSYMDYLIADPTIISGEDGVHYCEKVLYVPGSYQANDGKKRESERLFARSELGLPEDGFVYCCFNNTFKITPNVFDVWMQILKRVEGSVLWLLGGNKDVENNLRDEAEKRGVSGERIVFAEWMELEDHLARHRLADLFLDTFYYNAHTTASDALWMGLPVMTMKGATFSSNVAASLNKAACMEGYVVKDTCQYEEFAVRVAQDYESLRASREITKAKIRGSQLYSVDTLLNGLEQIYKKALDEMRACQS